jgi:hypothetical protein
VLGLLSAIPANRLAAAALAELLSRRRSCERIAEAFVRWSRAAEETAIVRDEYDGSREARDGRLEFLDRLEVEMVRRLVEPSEATLVQPRKSSPPSSG